MKAIVVGCGRLGAEVALALCQRGHAVCVVDQDPRTFDRLGAGFRGRIVEGVGFDREVLVRAGIKKADALAACTPSDNTNLLIARVARDLYRVPTVIARLYDPKRQAMYEHLSIHTVCTSLWGAEQMVQRICYPSWDVVGTLGNGEVQVVALPVTVGLAGKSVQAVTGGKALVAVGLTRAGRTALPGADQLLEQGDILYVGVDTAARDSVLARLVASDEEASI